MDKRKKNKDELGSKTGSVTVTIKKDKYLKISKKSELKNITVTQLIDDIVTREIENSEFLKRTAPALSLIRIEDDAVLIMDKVKNTKRIAEITIRNGRYSCDLDDNSNNCSHILFMLILSESIKFKDAVERI